MILTFMLLTGEKGKRKGIKISNQPFCSKKTEKNPKKWLIDEYHTCYLSLKVVLDYWHLYSTLVYRNMEKCSSASSLLLPIEDRVSLPFLLLFLLHLFIFKSHITILQRQNTGSNPPPFFPFFLIYPFISSNLGHKLSLRGHVMSSSSSGCLMCAAWVQATVLTMVTLWCLHYSVL